MYSCNSTAECNLTLPIPAVHENRLIYPDCITGFRLCNPGNRPSQTVDRAWNAFPLLCGFCPKTMCAPASTAFLPNHGTIQHPRPTPAKDVSASRPNALRRRGARVARNTHETIVGGTLVPWRFTRECPFALADASLFPSEARSTPYTSERGNNP